jgi:hypothetical protein
MALSAAMPLGFTPRYAIDKLSDRLHGLETLDLSLVRASGLCFYSRVQPSGIRRHLFNRQGLVQVEKLHQAGNKTENSFYTSTKN